MKRFSRFLIALSFLSFPCLASAAPDLNTGLDALRARDYATAVYNLEPLANDGNPQAAFSMCGMYYMAQGVPKNDAEAARYCHISAEKGNTEAMYNLALFYQKGTGVGQDFNEATRWYSAAAARGHRDAQYNLKQIQIANLPTTQSQRLEIVQSGAASLQAANISRQTAVAQKVSQSEAAPIYEQALPQTPAPAPTQVAVAQPAPAPAAPAAAVVAPVEVAAPVAPTPPVKPAPVQAPVEVAQAAPAAPSPQTQALPQPPVAPTPPAPPAQVAQASKEAVKETAIAIPQKPAEAPQQIAAAQPSSALPPQVLLSPQPKQETIKAVPPAEVKTTYLVPPSEKSLEVPKTMNLVPPQTQVAAVPAAVRTVPAQQYAAIADMPKAKVETKKTKSETSKKISQTAAKAPEPQKPTAPTTATTPEAQIALDLNRYCVMAAQRGNPDPQCAKEFAALAPASNNALATIKPIEKPAKIVEQKIETAQIAPVAEKKAETAKAVEVASISPTAVTALSKAQTFNIPTQVPAQPVYAPAHVAQTTAVLVANTTPMAEQPPEPKPATKTETPAPMHPLSWYITQANTGNAQAQNNLGVLYRRGLNGAKQNSAEAIRWFERSASQGSVNAMLNLASIYKLGEGVNQNLELAYAWYNMAAGRLPKGSNKRNRAQENVQEISQYMTNEQIGDALQYVAELEEHIPVMDEPIELKDESKVAEAKQ